MELKAAKRVAELCQQSKEPYSNLTMLAALKQTAREFSKKKRKKKKVISREQKHWSEEEKEKLEKLIGIYSYKTIAKMLGRTPKAVNEMRKRLKLGEPIRATEFLNSNELAEGLGRNSCTIRLWINKFKLPHVKKILANERENYRIDIKKFWKWAKENQKFMRWDLYTLGNLPNEPKWLIEEKKKPAEKTIKRDWTKTNETYLLFYYKQGLTHKEIADKLDRTVGAIDRKLGRLEAKRKQIQIFWKNEEDTILIDLRNKGKTFNFIANELGRSMDSTKARWHYINKVAI